MISKKNLDDRITKHSTFLQKQISNLRQRTLTSEQLTTEFQNQLQCAAKGHNFVFKKSASRWIMGIEVFRNSYQFKCTNCDLTIIKTIDELTPTEKKALKNLGILEEENGKTR